MVTDNYIRNQMQPHGLLYADNGSTYWNFTRNVLDSSEVEIWRNNTLPKWSHTADDEHLKYSYIYTTTLSKGLNTKVDLEADDVVFDNDTIYLCDAKNWPQEALDIIEASGLQAAYKTLPNGQAERIVTNISEDASLGANEEFQITVGFTDGKDKEVTGGEVVWYEVEDTSILNVTQTGVMTGCGKGVTTVRIYVLSNDILDVVEKVVHVGDEITAVYLTGFEDTISIIEGASGIQLKPYSETAMGRNPEFTEVTYTVADTGVATIDSNGYLKPATVGETRLTVTATAEGQTVSKEFKVVVKTLTGFTIDNLSEVFEEQNAEQWVKTRVDSWELIPDEQITSVIRRFAYYGGKKYENELLNFKLSISADGGTWPSIVLRAQDTKEQISSGTSGYIFCVTNTGLELHRFNGKVRTCIYGDNLDWAPNGGTGGHLITPNPLQRGEEHEVMVGAENVDDGVRIVLVVDGVLIIDFVDKGEGVITEPGYFGLVGKGETFVLTKVSETAVETPAPVPTPSDGDSDAGHDDGEDYESADDALTTGSSVTTGDNSSLGVYAILAIVTALCVAIIVLVSCKKRRSV